MPRQSRSRPAARPAPAAAPKTQTRSASTTAAPPMQAPPAPVPHPGAAAATGGGGGGGGLLTSMAATAGSVAMGSVVGHGLSSMLFGGSRSAEAAEQPAAQPAQQQQAMSCDFQAKQLTTCLESGDVQTCAWYIEQLKSCQAAARPY